jgi:thiamine monophosphate synthase
MGGINGSNIDQVIAQGAGKVAMVTAITQAEDVTEAVRALRQRILKYS